MCLNLDPRGMHGKKKPRYNLVTLDQERRCLGCNFSFYIFLGASLSCLCPHSSIRVYSWIMYQCLTSDLWALNDQLWVTKLEQKHSYRPDFLKCCCFFCLFFGGVLVCFCLFVTCLSYLLIAVVVWAYIRYLKPNSTKHMYNPNSLISPLAVNVIQLLWI